LIEQSVIAGGGFRIKYDSVPVLEKVVHFLASVCHRINNTTTSLVMYACANESIGGFMKRLGVAFVILLVVTCWFGLGHADETVVLTNGEWPPMFSKEFKHGGFGSRVCKEAFALGGVDVRYEYMPWKRGLELARVGQYAGTVGWRKSSEREKYFYFSDPLMTMNTVFFHKKSLEFDWNNLGDIATMNVGATNGYGYIDMLRPVIEQNGGKLDVASSDIANFRKLVSGRIDIFPCAEQVGYYLLRTKFIAGTADRIRHHTKPLLGGDLYLLISKKNKNGQELIERFNRGLKELRASGKFEQYENESLMGEYLPAK